MPRWIPKKEWEGLSAVVIGGGPSLVGFPWERIQGLWTIGCNSAYKLGKNISKVCAFGDHGFFSSHRKQLEQYGAPVFTNDPELIDANLPWLYWVPRQDEGVSKKALGWNRNTGAMAINLAALLGASRIYLLGFDMKMPAGRSNWYRTDNAENTPGLYREFNSHFHAVKRGMENEFPEVTVLNVTNDSDLEVFPKISVVDFLVFAARESYDCSSD